MGGSALVTILRNPVYADVVVPELYSKAAGEWIFLVILSCGVVSSIWNPAVFEANALKDVLGYNSPCVVWDTPPGRYVAAAMWGVVIYFNVRFCVLLGQRSLVRNEDTTTRWVVAGAAWMYAISTLLVPVNIVIPPDVSWRAHFLAFSQLIVFRLIAVAATYYEFPLGVTLKSKIFLVAYTLASVIEFSGCMLPILFYVDGSRQHIVPPMLQQTVDYIWFIMLPLTSVFGVQTPGLKLSIQVAEEGYDKLEKAAASSSAASPSELQSRDSMTARQYGATSSFSIC